MNKLKSSPAAKLVAVVLLCVMALVFLGSLLVAELLNEIGAYSGSLESARRTMLEQLCTQRAQDATSLIVYEGAWPDTVYAQENFRFALYGPDGELIYQNWEGGPFLAHVSYQLRVGGWESVVRPTVTSTPQPTATPDGEEAPDSVPSAEPEPEIYRMEGYIPETLVYQDEIAHMLHLYELGYSLRYAVFAAAGLSFLLGVLLFVFLCAAAGHHAGDEEIHESFVDRMPLELLTALMVLGVGAAIALVGESFRLDGPVLILDAVLVLAGGLLFLLWCLSVAVRIKRGTLWQNSLCARLLRGINRLLRALGRGLATIPLLRRELLILAAVWALEVFLLALADAETEIVLLWLMEHLLLTALAVYLLLSFRRLRDGAKAIAAGDEQATVDERGLVLDLREHARDLNHIRDGLSAAVAERMKSERFRTELITNVSHDIKTPLTSILSYVDLLEKEGVDGEHSREYLEVLRRQSERLKKLLEDLIEASKASSGSLPVDKTRCELGVLLDQMAGEYAERLEAAGLELVTDKPETPLFILADGRQLWRVVDNLMQNILKYAQPGTRVYLSLERQGDEAQLRLRNISREKLNISAEELMERFVRGDSARSGEGSGLGLSIAQSLTQLQGGSMELTVDGDLFKVCLSFPALPEQPEA